MELDKAHTLQNEELDAKDEEIQNDTNNETRYISLAYWLNDYWGARGEKFGIGADPYASIIDGSIHDAREKPLTRQEVYLDKFARRLGNVVGAILGLVIIVSIWELFRVRCPTAPNGSQCNGVWGSCTGHGYCNCTTPLFSGEACADNGCPGFLSETNQMCNGRGLCTAGIQSKDIPDVCRWEVPSLDNGFKPLYTNGWTHPDCVVLLQESLDLIDVIVEEEQLSAIEDIEA
ncbi:MAG: hypothetical protein ACTSUE_26230, partial [Promethearchaeota archaeon]